MNERKTYRTFARSKKDFADQWKKERKTLLDERKKRHCRSSKDVANEVFADEVLLMNELEVIASWA